MLLLNGAEDGDDERRGGARAQTKLSALNNQSTKDSKEAPHTARTHEVAPEIPAETRRASPSKPRGRTKQPPQKAARRGPYVEIEYEDENDALPMRVAADARGR